MRSHPPYSIPNAQRSLGNWAGNPANLLLFGLYYRMAEIETLDAPGHNLKRTLKDLFAGAAGGIAQVLTGM